MSEQVQDSMPDRAAAPPEQTVGNALVQIEKRGAAGLVTLARPEKRNALSAAMRETLAAAYPRLAREPIIYAAVVRSACAGVFSAGADLDELSALGRRDTAALRAAVGEALGLCWLQESFTKPTVALIDGIAMGSGFGIGLHGTHRVAGERYAFACPETGIGLVPAGGMCHALARLPGSIGLYLALTGKPIRRADAFHLGLATHCISADRFDAVVTHLAAADPVDEVLENLHGDPGPGDLDALAPIIARCFGATSIESILAGLDAENGAHATWARQTAACLRRKSPLALKVTFRLLAEAGTLDLWGLLRLEHRVLCRLMSQPDFEIGVRAALADASGSPAWAHAQPEDVTPAMVTGFFADDAGPMLALPRRAEMQGKGAEPAGGGLVPR